MKRSIFLPIVLIALFIIFVSAACKLPFGSKDTATEEPQVIVVTATPEGKDSNVVSDSGQNDQGSNDEVVADDSSTDSSMDSGAQLYFTDNFDGNMDNYSKDVVYGSNSDPENADINVNNGALRFDLNDYDLYTYVNYDPYTYTDVRIDLEAENLATSNNSVTLYCRYDPELGWYEYNIDNDGEWTLYYYDMVIAKDYVKLYDGGSTAINMGRDTNVYTMICQGRELSLYINGTFTHSFEHKDLKEGYVGFGVSSYSAYPVKINVNWFEVSEP